MWLFVFCPCICFRLCSFFCSLVTYELNCFLHVLTRNRFKRGASSKLDCDIMALLIVCKRLSVKAGYNFCLCGVEVWLVKSLINNQFCHWGVRTCYIFLLIAVKLVAVTLCNRLQCSNKREEDGAGFKVKK